VPNTSGENPESFRLFLGAREKYD